jgi:RluA family pseudouridine synthase
VKKNPPYAIVHQDEDILAVNKASGVSVCADWWNHASPRLDQLLREVFSTSTALLRVHRIDNGCSGLVVFAKNAAAHKRLSLEFESRAVKRTYIAVVHGRTHWDETECALPLRADGTKDHLTIVDKRRGKPAITQFTRICGAPTHSVLSVRPLTDRQHQIRVHLASLGHPIVCDELYGTAHPLYLSKLKRAWRGDPNEERPLIARLALHSETLTIQNLFLEAPLHKDIAALINQLKRIQG